MSNTLRRLDHEAERLPIVSFHSQSKIDSPEGFHPLFSPKGTTLRTTPNPSEGSQSCGFKDLLSQIRPTEPKPRGGHDFFPRNLVDQRTRPLPRPPLNVSKKVDYFSQVASRFLDDKRHNSSLLPWTRHSLETGKRTTCFPDCCFSASKTSTSEEAHAGSTHYISFASGRPLDLKE